MARWRHEALRRLPELRDAIISAHEIMALWIKLWFALEKAYQSQPHDESLIVRIYSYADWCEAAPRNSDAGHDPLTAVIVAFYEHLPTSRAVWDDMPRWFTAAQVRQNKSAFAYLIGEEKFAQLLLHMEKNRKYYVERATDVET